MTSQVLTVTVTHADVLYVVQQIKKDLSAWSDAYPSVVSKDKVYTCHDEACTFLMHDAVTCLWYTIEDPTKSHYVYHQLRFEISYSGNGSRVGLGGRAVTPQALPPSARFIEAVSWSATMRALPVAKQQQILESTRFGVPGSGGSLNFTYGAGAWQQRVYGSGALEARVHEYKGR